MTTTHLSTSQRQFPGEWRETYHSAKFFQKLHEVEENWKGGSKMLQYTALIEKLLHMADFINLKK